MKNASPRARPRSSESWDPQAGQGTFEYMLVLIVSVLIILGILYQFNQAFKVYVAAYFGDYVSCLLEVGELPGISSECSVPDFSLKNGKKLITSIGDGSGGSSSSKGSSTSSSSTSSKDGSNASKSASGGSSSSSSGSGANSESAAANSSTRSPAGNSGRTRFAAAGSLGAGGGARGTQDDVLGISPTSTAVGRYSQVDRARNNNMAWGYYDTSEAKQKEDEQPPLPQASGKVSQNGKLKGKSTKFESTRKAASVEKDEDEGFSFGAMIRLLMIILMIVAIVVFFGGQILQIAKSGDE